MAALDLDAVGAIYVKQSGAWAEIGEVWQRIAGAWVRLWGITDPLAVSAADVFGARASGGTVAVPTSPCTATVAGGSSPYTYAWTFVSGDSGWSINDPTLATTRFTVSLAPGAFSNAVFRVTVTDFTGAVETADVNATAENYGDLGGLS